MPVAILLGIPTPYVQRIRAAVERGRAAFREGWTVEYVPVGGGTPEIRQAEIELAMRRAATHGAPHVVGVSKQDASVRKEVARKLRQFFRFLWLDNRLLFFIPHDIPQFVTGLNAVLEQEEMWAAQVQPKTEASPLVLPECSFGAERSHRDVWELAERFGEARNIRAAALAIDAFHAAYWRATPGGSRRWVDSEGRVFEHQGARHYEAPFPRDWKYSFKLPTGFHYDVNHLGGREFVCRDVQQKSHAVGRERHLNMDAHGHVL